jgi:hypothetical protein
MSGYVVNMSPTQPGSSLSTNYPRLEIDGELVI